MQKIADDEQLRTKMMFNNMKKHQWLTFRKHGDKNYLSLNSKQYLIIERWTTDFCTEAMISVGASLEREIILLDPQHAELKKRYKDLKSRIKKNLPLQDVFNTIIAYLRKKIFTAKDLNNGVKEIANNWTGDKYKGHPIIPLQHFLNLGVGVCRHHALAVAYLLNCLMNDELIPQGRIYHCRDNVPNGAHVFIIFQPFNQPNSLYLLDSLWNIQADILSKNPSELSKLTNYGQKVIEKCKLYRNIFTKSNYRELSYDKEKKFFIMELLGLSENERRELLNREFSRGKDNITRLAYDVKNKNIAPDMQHKNYGIMLSDIERVLSTPRLHSVNYKNLKDTNDRQQFVLGLLNLPEKSWTKILDLQSNDLLNLQQLERSLNANLSNRKPLYAKFANFNDINKKLEWLVEEKSAQQFLGCLEKYILAHNWRVGPQFKSCKIATKTVPTNVFKQFAQIAAAKRGEISYVQAKKEILAIGKRESMTSKFFRKRDTINYYALFKDDMTVLSQKIGFK